MKIGYCVEGATDRALLAGLRERWCPGADLVEGSFRGTTEVRLRAEIPKICRELDYKGCEIIVFLTDSNEQRWQDVMKRQKDKVPPNYREWTICAVAERNVECWLCADRDWIAGQTGRNTKEFAVNDPKGVFESAIGVTSIDRKEERISALVLEAPLKNWIKRSRSFEDFYENGRTLSKNLPCEVPNERDS